MYFILFLSISTPSSPPSSLSHQIPSIFDDETVRDFLSLDDQRSTIPIYDRESLDEEAGSEDKMANRFDLGTSEKESAAITDFKLLKVIGKGSFGKVSSYYSVP